jgi:hypothetical protein
MADIDNFEQSWQGLTHGEVEDAIKAKVAELETAISEGGTDLQSLRSDVQNLKTQINNLPSWAKQSTKPSYNANEIGGVGGYANLLAKLNAMDAAIADAAASGGEVDLSDYYTKTQVDNLLGTKANDNAVVKSISVNGGVAQTPDNGNVNIEVQGGEQGKSAYQSYLDTTSDSPKKSEAEWVASLRGNDGVASGDEVVVVHDTNGEPSNLEQGQVAVLGADLGVAIGKVFNVNTQDENNASPYRLWVGTQQQLDNLDEYEDDVIYLVGTVPVVAQKFNVTFNLTNTNVPSNTPTKAKEGAAFSVTVSPDNGYTIDSATGTMAGGTLTKTENQNGTVTFSTQSVTGAITITSVATLHISSIAISQGARVGNNIPLTAEVSPANADNVTLEWSIDNTNDFNITDNGNGTATLTVREGADNASVTVTCQDTNTASGTAQGTLQLTGLSYEDTPIPTTAITGITASRTSANTLGLTLVKTPASSNSAINYSLANVPKVMRLDSNGDPTYQDAATINSSTGEITYKAAAVYYAYDSVNDEYNYIPASGYDFALDVIATRSDDNTVTKTQTIQVTHDSGDVMWFEDLNVLRVIKGSATTDTPTEDYTFANAANRTAFKPSATYKTLIERFIEFKYFGSTSMGPNASNHATFNGCSKLKCLGIPSGITKFETSVVSASPVYGCPLKEVHFANIVNYCGVDHKFNDTDTFNGSFGTASIDATLGLGLYIDGEEKTELVIPSSVAAIKQFAFSGFNHITKLTLNYDGVVSGNNSFKGKDSNNTTVNLLANIDLYVPSGQLASYQSNSYWSTAKSINAITE